MPVCREFDINSLGDLVLDFLQGESSVPQEAVAGTLEVITLSSCGVHSIQVVLTVLGFLYLIFLLHLTVNVSQMYIGK